MSTALSTRVLYPHIRRDREDARIRQAIAWAASHPVQSLEELLPTANRRTRNDHRCAAIYLLQQALAEYDDWFLMRSIWRRTRSALDRPPWSRAEARARVDRAASYYEDWQ